MSSVAALGAITSVLTDPNTQSHGLSLGKRFPMQRLFALVSQPFSRKRNIYIILFEKIQACLRA